MTCKECICYEVCENGQLFETPCVHYKNKADFVEVVRCKDCERVNKYKDRYFCSADNYEMDSDDFCSCGKREER